MSRWNAVSDLDYYAEVEGRHAPVEYSVCCVSCSRIFYVRADEQPPYRCADCCEVHEADAERQTA